MTETVPAAEVPDHFAEVAASLYRIADDLVTLTGSGLPKPRFHLSIQPGKFNGGDDLNAGAVDAVTSALFGHPGQAELMSDDVYHYSNGDEAELVGPVVVRVLTGVSTEWAKRREAAAKLAEREAELEKLRAEVAELRAAADASGLNFSREADDPTPVSPARGPLQVGGAESHIAQDGRREDYETPVPVREHYEARGWKGTEPGTCGVECACGVAYDGFDSLAEAAELLARHIEKPVSEASA